MMKSQAPELKPNCEPNRYQISATRHSDGAATIRVIDRRGCLFFEWHGSKARHLIDAGVVPPQFCNAGFCNCRKSDVWHLILAASATEQMLGQMGYTDFANAFHKALPRQLTDRLRQLNQSLAGPQMRIAQVLFAYPGRHFTPNDVDSLLRLEMPCHVAVDAPSVLDELAHMKLVQRIEVDANNIFYDTNTTPHVHLFDVCTRELRDATIHGVIQIDECPTTAAVQLKSGDELIIRNAVA